MAELIGTSASILGIAAFGASVATTLRSFARSYSGAEQNINDLVADVALTASILVDLAKTIEECEEEFRLKADNFARAQTVCHRNLERSKKALSHARKPPKFRNESSLEKRFQEEEQVTSAWEKLKFALGGEDALKELVTSIGTSKSNLQLLLDSTQLLILKKLNKKFVLSQNER